MANIILSKESSSTELKCYFEAVLKLAQSANEFPINLDECWMLVYKERCIAVRALKSNFIEGIDFCLTKKSGKKDGSGGHNKETYMLSTSCLEYFIARKVRPVFEVYRQVFHKVATTPMLEKQLEERNKRIRTLEMQVMRLEAKAEAAIKIQKQETDLKNSCFYYLIDKRLYDDWNEYRMRFEQERIYKNLLKEDKKIKAIPLPW